MHTNSRALPLLVFLAVAMLTVWLPASPILAQDTEIQGAQDQGAPAQDQDKGAPAQDQDAPALDVETEGAEAPRLRSDFGPFDNIVVIPIEGTIDDALATSLERRVEEARASGADCIVFDIDTYGGELFAMDRITGLIYPLPPLDESEEGIHTVAYVSDKAISAGVMIAFSCREIFMKRGTRMGDCEPITFGGAEGIQTLPEKIQSPTRAKFRTYAERNGYPIAIAEAMVTKELGLVRIRFEGEEEPGYYSILETEEWPEEKRARIASEEIILLKGQLPTFTDSESIEYGLSKGTVRDRDELLDLLSGGEYVAPDEGAVLEMNWSEDLARFLQAWKFVFFIIGVIGLYLEFKTPGFGVPGVVGIIGFALLFGSSYVTGLAETWEILVFFAGVILLAVEIFVLPGFGIPGVLGLFMILASFYLASQPFIVPSTADDTLRGAYEMKMALEWMMQFGLSLVVVFVLVSLLARWLPKTTWFGRLILTPVPAGDSLAMAGAGTAAQGAGQAGSVAVAAEGKTLTKLRPAGFARIDGRRVEVVTGGDFIDAGVPVVVTEVHGNRVVVKKTIS